LHAGRDQAYALWHVGAPEAERVAGDTQNDDELQTGADSFGEELDDNLKKTQDDFWESLEGMLLEGQSVCSPGLISFMGEPLNKDAAAEAP
ncbi:MAG: hypothetical protein KKC51_07885, partial [Verrucomicrobia bacterium]|nr:hypothetical protein [Verrucomicrobiota bacterium]